MQRCIDLRFHTLRQSIFQLHLLWGNIELVEQQGISGILNLSIMQMAYILMLQGQLQLHVSYNKQHVYRHLQHGRSQQTIHIFILAQS